MSMQKITEIRAMSRGEVLSSLKDSKKEAMNLRLQLNLTVGLQNTSYIRLLKRQIARLLTVLREKKCTTDEAVI